MQQGGMNNPNMQQMLQSINYNPNMQQMYNPMMMDSQEKDSQSFDMSRSMSESGTFGKKRKRGEDDESNTEEEDDEDSQSGSKKMKNEEPGNEENKSIQFDNHNLYSQNMPGIQNLPQPPFSGNPNMQGMQHIPHNLMQMNRQMYQQQGGTPFFINKSGFMPGDNQNQPPPQWGQQIPFGQSPLMMYKQENIVEVEPYFQNILMKSPPSDGLTEKLPSSKTPVIDAFIYCAICNWGVTISPTQDRLPGTFTINDFNKYWDYSQKICSKPSPTETPVARLKALRRWFADFPGIKKIKAVKEGKEPIMIKVKQERIADVIAIVKKYSQIINTRCRTLVQSSINHQPPFSNNMENNNDYQ